MRPAPWNIRPREWRMIVLVVLTIVAVVFGSLALGKADSAARAESNVAFHTVAPIAKHPTAVFVGGTFTQGAGASSPGKAWPALISHTRGWKQVDIASPANDIFAVTGACPTTGCTANKSVVAAVVSANPRVVVVGAQLDPKSNPSTVDGTVAATIQAIRLAIPSVYIIAVGPTIPPGGDSTRLIALDSTFRSIAADESATYVSLLSPTGLNSTQFAVDKSGPNDAGQAIIAQRIEASLSS